MLQRFKDLRGSAIVEMAVVLPLFVMLLVGIVEFSRVLMVKQVITNAAREGARAGAINLDDAQALANANSVTQNYITSSGVNLGSANVTSIFVTTGGSQGLQVTIDYNYDSLLTPWIPGIPDSFTLRSVAIMRRES